MRAVVFNINHVVMLFIIFECVLFAFFLLFINRGKKISNVTLGGFLLLNALLALETTLYWTIPIKQALAEISPNLFFLTGFAFFMLGPTLYWYTKSRIYRAHAVSRYDALHLVPALVSMLYLYLMYYSQPDEYKLLLLNDFSMLNACSWFTILSWSQRLSAVIYGLVCVQELLQYKTYLKQNFSNIEPFDLAWLKLLIIGFLSIWIWQVLTLSLEPFIAFNIVSNMARVGNYVLAILINALVLYNLSQSDILVGVESQFAIQDQGARDKDSSYHIKLLNKVISHDKPYLDPDVTLEKLASKIPLSPRILSALINQHFQKNFFEFINYHRIEEAKQLLTADKEKSPAVSEVMEKVGFKTKSAFNIFFKRFVGMTPSQYKRQNGI